MRLNWVNLALLGCVLASPVYAQTGSSKTATLLNSEIATTLASGQTPTITALQLRQVLVDMVASSLNSATGSVLIGQVGTAVNSITISGSVAGNPTSIVSAGTDTSVGILYLTQSTGSHVFRPGADTPAALTIQTADGLTNLLFVNTLTGTTGITGGLTVNGAANPLSPTLTLTGATAPTIPQPVLSMTQTWISGLTTYTGVLLNITNTASATGSMLMDLQLGGTSLFNVAKNGLATVSAAFAVNENSINGTVIGYNVPGLVQGTGGVVGWTSGAAASATVDTGLSRNAAGIVEINNATAGTFRDLRVRSYIVGSSTPTPTGTCAAPTMAGGNTAGTMTTGTGCGGTTIILTFGLTAPTGWNCQTTNRTVSTRVMPQTGSSTTTATFTGTTSNNDVLGYSCMAY